MSRVNWAIARFEEAVVAIGLAAATVATFLDVILRYVFSTSTGWGGEFTIYCIIYAAMIGAAAGVRSGTHIGVDVLVQQMPPRIGKAVIVAGLIASALFTLGIVVLGIQIVLFALETGQVTNDMLIPRWLIYISVPLGTGLMTYHLLQEVVAKWRTPPEEIFEHEPAGLQVS